LLDLLKPIGDYRKSHKIPAEGKRRKKRKREDQDQTNDGTESVQPIETQMPAVLDFLTIGFNSTTRALENMSKRSRPAVLEGLEVDHQKSAADSSHLTAVFVCRSVLSDPITASIPLLIATASLAQPKYPPIRLMQLSAGVESQLAEALHQPKVGFVGIRNDITGADVLLAVVRAAMRPVRVPWLDGSAIPRYLPVQIASTETSPGSTEKPSQISAIGQRTQPKGKGSKAGPFKGESLKGELLRAEHLKGKSPTPKPQFHS
jgi:ribonuclease P/MRP protein subunit POP3